MSEIPRRSKLKLNPDERKRLLRDCERELSKGINDSEKVSSSQEIADGLIGSLYEDIGHLDYRMYDNADANISDEQKLENLKIYLVNRVYKSAMLEAFENEASKKGIIIKKKFKLKDATPEELRDKYGNQIYHGTVADVKPEELGEADKDGKYKVRDGILYFTKKEGAEKFANNVKKNNPDKTHEPWVYTRDISQNYKDNECVKLDGILTTGWTGYLYQDEIKELCEEGKKYVFSGTPQILDIHNFSKFIEARDTAISELLEKYNLRLPEPEESLNEYVTNALGIDEQQFENIIAAENKRVNEKEWSTRTELKQSNPEKSINSLAKEALGNQIRSSEIDTVDNVEQNQRNHENKKEGVVLGD